MQAPSPTACLIIIGNEILSGRTQDKNLAWLAKELNEIGIRLIEARVIPDIDSVIADTVNACRKAFTYVFTTGGIGPTHDDITTASIAKAFGVAVEKPQAAVEILERHYTKEQLNAARLKMAEMPVGATMVQNPVSAAPGYYVENVFVFAGVPAIMQAMFAGIKGELKGGAKTHSKVISAYITEGIIAEALTNIQNRYPDVEIGSYPFIKNQRLGTNLVTRSTDTTQLEQAYNETKAMLLVFTPDISEENLVV